MNDSLKLPPVLENIPVFRKEIRETIARLHVFQQDLSLTPLATSDYMIADISYLMEMAEKFRQTIRRKY